MKNKKMATQIIEYTGSASPLSGGEYFVETWDGTDFTGSFHAASPKIFDDVINSADITACCNKVEESHPTSQPTPRPH